ncbi:MAG: ParA family protein, partial [Actinobacteria bacterium]|nr:ParA family protein [Actinomycetota bacterium]
VLERVVDTFGEQVFDTVIGRTVKLPDAQIAAKSILDYAPENPASEAYLQLARELVERGTVA